MLNPKPASPNAGKVKIALSRRKGIRCICGKYFDGRVGDELEGADDEDEHAHYVAVASEFLGEGELDLGLDFVLLDLVVVGEGGEVLEEDVEGGGAGEEEEEEENVVAVDEVVGFGGGVVEPEGLQGGQGPAQGGGGFVDGFVGQHR